MILPHLIFAYTGSIAILASQLPGDPPKLDSCIYGLHSYSRAFIVSCLDRNQYDQGIQGGWGCKDA